MKTLRALPSFLPCTQVPMQVRPLYPGASDVGSGNIAFNTCRGLTTVPSCRVRGSGLNKPISRITLK
ncbi:Uncharacterised protein [Vibrio cholerae]|nr:Uncharacterised protein [Vibrio cholerae]